MVDFVFSRNKIPIKITYSLFDDIETPPGCMPGNILPKDGEVIFMPHFFSLKESNELYDALIEKTEWKQEKIKMYGRLLDVPRLTAWYGNTNKDYTYSGISMKANHWFTELLEIKRKVEAAAGSDFTSVLLNLYRNGQDSVAWHCDNEPELGRDPVIASVSFGATRTFKLRHLLNKALHRKLELQHGSLLLMKGSTQHHWEHCIPKTTHQIRPRINLTFRVIR